MKRMVLSVLFSILSILSGSSLAHKDGAYYHDPDDLPDRSAWMATLKDDLYITEISIPGTHGSASNQWEDITNNQILSITQQLTAGIRYLDLRVKNSSDKLLLVHGPIYLFNTFDNALADMQAFLEQNPTEVVLVRVKKEREDSKSKNNFETNVKNALNNFSGIVWQNNSSSSIPRLSDVRGKVVILQNFSTSNGTVGIGYNNFSIQDNYHLDNNWELHDKWSKVKSHIEKANKEKHVQGYINYLSASGGVLPYFVASGHVSNSTGASRLSTGLTTPGWKWSYPDFPRTGCFFSLCTISFEGTNTLTRNYLTRSHIDYVGIIAADFPGSDLITKILDLNTRAGIHYKLTYTIRNELYSGCFDFRRGISKTGQNLVINPNCHKTGAQRITYYTDSKELKVLGQDGKEYCIEAQGGLNKHRQPIVSSICNSSNGQKWNFNIDKTISSLLAGTKRCLDVDQHRRDTYGNPTLTLWHCSSDSPDQLFERWL